MKICFVLSDIKTEKPQTSVLMIHKAQLRGHEVYVMGVGDFIFHQEDKIGLRAKKIPPKLKEKNLQKFWEKIQVDVKPKPIDSQQMDVLFLRNNPTEETGDREWAKHSALAFARMIQQNGVLVLNDAFATSHAFIDKLYFEELPAEIKPKSIITRDVKELLNFWEENGKNMVLKPLEGSGGQNIYKIEESKNNFNQIVKNLIDSGYVIAQEFLPGVSKGDVRVFLMNGKILEQDKEQAIIRRLSTDTSEFRHNLSLGAKPEKAELTPEIEHIVKLTAPKLIRDGLFFVGLDIVQNKLIELNVLSPGGIEHTKITGMTDFSDAIIEAIERKIKYKQEYKDQLSNKILATMD